MGTRAVIKFGETFIATHWDGDPGSLGQDLLDIKKKTLAYIIKTANKHTIDSATEDVLVKENPKRFKKIADKANKINEEKHNPKRYTVEELVELSEKENKCLSFGLMSAGDWPIGKFEKYGDWAEYIYDVLEDDAIRYAELDGAWSGYVEEEFEWKSLRRSKKE